MLLSKLHRVTKYFRRNAYKSPFILPINIYSASADLPLPLYGGRHLVTGVPGTGRSAEVFKMMEIIFKHIHVPVDFEIISGDDVEALLEDGVVSVKRNKVALKGNMPQSLDVTDAAPINAHLNRKLDLYANILLCKSLPKFAKKENIDIIVARQNVGNEYAMLEHMLSKSVAISYKVTIESCIHRLGRFTYEYAKLKKRKHVTIIHGSSERLARADGLFLDTLRNVARNYPEIKTTNMSVTDCIRRLVTRPEMFDVMICSNLIGSSLTNTICALTGEAFLVSGKNYGEKYAIFEPGLRMAYEAVDEMHNANPIAMVNAAIDMLHYLDLTYFASAISSAVYKTLYEHKVRTKDLGGTATTEDVVSKILECLDSFLPNQKPITIKIPKNKPESIKE